MFVRFRISKERYQVSLVASWRDKNGTHQEHLSGLGGLPVRSTKLDRGRFWAGVKRRMAGLGERIHAQDLAKIIAAIERRVPCPTAAEDDLLELWADMEVAWEREAAALVAKGELKPIKGMEVVVMKHPYVELREKVEEVAEWKASAAAPQEAERAPGEDEA